MYPVCTRFYTPETRFVFYIYIIHFLMSIYFLSLFIYPYLMCIQINVYRNSRQEYFMITISVRLYFLSYVLQSNKCSKSSNYLYLFPIDFMPSKYLFTFVYIYKYLGIIDICMYIKTLTSTRSRLSHYIYFVIIIFFFFQQTFSCRFSRFYYMTFVL